MSIWASVGIDDTRRVHAVTDDGDAAWYRGEGAPDGEVDVATTTWHRLIRLSVSSDGIDFETLLPPDSARLLAERLMIAADRVADSA